MIKIGVFFGSQSVEHEVSVITALQAMNHLKNLEDYSIVPVFIDKSGDWYTGQASCPLRISRTCQNSSTCVPRSIWFAKARQSCSFQTLSSD